MMTIETQAGRPTLEEAADLLRVPISAIDEAFGVLLIDPERRLYAVQVDAEALIRGKPSSPRVKGPFANPPIEPLEN
jgi:hypothetical protein